MYRRGERSEYSDLGFILLGKWSNGRGKPLDEYFDESVARPLERSLCASIPLETESLFRVDRRWLSRASPHGMG